MVREVQARFAQEPETTTELEGILLEGLSAGEVGVWSWDVRTGRLYWSPNLEEIHRLPPGRFDGSFDYFRNDIHPEDRERVMDAVQTVLDRGGTYAVEYRLLPREGEGERWLEARGRVRKEGDAIVGAAGICEDITERKHARIELERRSRQQETIARLGQAALGENHEDLQGLLNQIAGETAAALDVELCHILELMPGGEQFLLRAGVGWRDGTVGNARACRADGTQGGYALRVGGAVVVEDWSSETRFPCPRLLREHGVVCGVSVVIAGEDGRPFGILGVHSTARRQFAPIDVDFLRAVANIVASALHRSRANERQDLLISELRHRVGNLLSLITSLFNNSASRAESVSEVQEKFLARIMSLARAHSMISQSGWRTASLSDVVEAVLSPYSDRLDIEGSHVELGADSALALSLAMHELATNASKYGSLSVPQGTLVLRWSDKWRDQRAQLVLDWIETGGPRTAPPEKQGFGSKLVRTVIERQLNGAVDIAFAEDGLRVNIEIPLS